ncbi:DUF3258 domain-containing protein [Pseudoalteromonas sp. BZP1]|uniref:DUF3258 domain-containing protein n=1 Tax=unclassified Pseudoalteromonas TaxID=194690 RepID=UPI0032C4092E
MRHIKLPENLILRNERFYFRYVFPRKFIGSDIRISLKTKNLQCALQRLDLISPHVNKLKELASSRNDIDTKQLVFKAKSITDDMKQALTFELSKKIIAEEQQGYSSKAHAISGFKTKGIHNHSPEHLRIAAEIMLAIAEGSSDELLVDALNRNDFEVLNIFVLVTQYMSLKNSGVSNQQICANTQVQKSIRQFAKMIDIFSSVGMPIPDESEPDFDFFDDFEVDDFSAEDQDAIEVLNKHDVQFDTNSLEFIKFKSLLENSRNLQTKFLASCLLKDQESQQVFESLITPKFNEGNNTNPIPKSEPSGPLFSKVHQEFLDFKIKEGLSERLQNEYARFYEIWCLLVEDKPIETYKASDIGRFIDRCYQLPKKNIAPYNKMSFKECLDYDVPSEDCIQPKTVQGYYKWLQGVFSYAKRDTVEYIQHSPCTIKREFKQRIRGAFNSVELNKFETFAMQTKSAWQKWSLLLAMYTGARRTEIYQLRKSDIRREDGVDYILVTDEHESQRLKTENAKRRIPIHKRLIELGFLDYVENTNERILYEITSAESITSWFARLITKLDIASVNELDEMRSFHSFRHTFISNIRNNHSFDLALLQQVVGHELSKGGITDKYTHKSADLKRLAEVVNAFFISK